MPLSIPLYRLSPPFLLLQAWLRDLRWCYRNKGDMQCEVIHVEANITLKYIIWCLSVCLIAIHSVVTNPISTKLERRIKGHPTEVVLPLHLSLSPKSFSTLGEIDVNVMFTHQELSRLFDLSFLRHGFVLLQGRGTCLFNRQFASVLFTL